VLIYKEFTFRLPREIAKSFEVFCRMQGEDPAEVFATEFVKVFQRKLGAKAPRSASDPQSLIPLPPSRVPSKAKAPKKRPSKPDVHDPHSLTPIASARVSKASKPKPPQAPAAPKKPAKPAKRGSEVKKKAVRR